MRRLLNEKMVKKITECVRQCGGTPGVYEIEMCAHKIMLMVRREIRFEAALGTKIEKLRLY